MNKSKDIKVKKNVASSNHNVPKTRNNIVGSKATQNQTKNSKVKKILVRNTERPVPESRVIKSYSTDHEDNHTKTTQIPEKKTTVESFDTPEPYSSLSLSKQVDYITKYRKVKSLSDPDKKLAFDEKVSRQVNFPYNQPIYKDLISLRCEKILTPPFTATRSPLPQKDKEITLSDFIKPRIVTNYYSSPSVDIQDKIVPCRNNNLRLHKILHISSR